MAMILELKSYNDLNIFINSLVMAVQGGIVSREQAQGIFKDQLYESGLLKRPPVFTKTETKKKE
jgi:hypothetical protein